MPAYITFFHSKSTQINADIVAKVIDFVKE
jgi:hypothetical protein